MSAQSAAADYTYQRPSTTATRAMVTGTKPAVQPSTSSVDSPDTHLKSTREQARTTDNYERAAAEAAKSGKASAAVAPASSNADNTAGDSGTVRPGIGRQRSWQMRDFKGEQQGSLLGGVAPGHGYSSTGK